ATCCTLIPLPLLLYLLMQAPVNIYFCNYFPRVSEHVLQGLTSGQPLGQFSDNHGSIGVYTSGYSRIRTCTCVLGWIRAGGAWAEDYVEIAANAAGEDNAAICVNPG